MKIDLRIRAVFAETQWAENQPILFVSDRKNKERQITTCLFLIYFIELYWVVE
jgi:hypothetical protein